MSREAMTNKLLILGVDGMDPRITKYLLDQGRLPNIQKYIDRGSCREDLHFLGRYPDHHASLLDDFGYRRLSRYPWHHLLLASISLQLRCCCLQYGLPQLRS